ncbi:hypothetical protein OGM63_10740 [Plectonema radiosum NIES-515]|uniref:Uncharacterized protein n=1 Tax=Plectonema radiosum NIES-515 TaxID=2986073 RepID=A0ABT3AXY4_9CYAN|nr:hypothetical protein [Plectonema radiosum]MCV3213986.1 hypothetical protein [Plectonema radiosum NIES-515]
MTQSSIDNNRKRCLRRATPTPCRKPQKQMRSLLWKSECDRFAEDLKNKAIALCIHSIINFANTKLSQFYSQHN